MSAAPESELLLSIKESFNIDYRSMRIFNNDLIFLFDFLICTVDFAALKFMLTQNADVKIISQDMRNSYNAPFISGFLACMLTDCFPESDFVGSRRRNARIR